MEKEFSTAVLFLRDSPLYHVKVVIFGHLNASLYIYHFSTVTDLSSEKYSEFLYWYQEFLCPVESLYFSDEKSITVEK